MNFRNKIQKNYVSDSVQNLSRFLEDVQKFPLVKEEDVGVSSDMKKKFSSSVSDFLKALGSGGSGKEGIEEDARTGANIRMLSPKDMETVLNACGKKGAASANRLIHTSTKDPSGKPITIDIKASPNQKNKPNVIRVTKPVGGDYYIDLDKLKQVFLDRPKDIIAQNAKLKKSGTNTIFYDLTMPAYHGLYYDEKEKGFGLVSTCPGAGACILWCYASKGGYVQYPGPVNNAAKMLTFLMNHPDEFEDTLLQSLENAKRTAKEKRVIMRWHDAGDFFSTGYLDLALDVARKTPDILHYAYTKQLPLIRDYQSQGKIPENFIFNFSVGGKYDKTIDVMEKFADVIPKNLFDDIPVLFTPKSIKMTKQKLVKAYESNGLTEEVVDGLAKESGVEKVSANLKGLLKSKAIFKQKILGFLDEHDMKNEKKKVGTKLKLQKNFTDESVQTLKERTAKKLNIPVETILSYPEMMDRLKNNDEDFLSKKNYWHILVWSGHGDDAPTRKEVKGTLLLIH